MAESYPTDETLNALSGTCDALTGLAYPTIGESPYYTSFYRLAEHINRLLQPANALRVYKDGDLTFGLRSGSFAAPDDMINVSSATAQALTDNAINYIYLTSNGTLTVNTIGFVTDSANAALATVATGSASAGSVGGTFSHEDITDCRDRAMFSAPGPVSGQPLALPVDRFKRTGDLADLPSTADGSNLSLVAAAHGSASTMVVSSAADNSTVTEKARFLTALPNDYLPGAELTLRLRAQIGAAMNVSATIDAEIYQADGEGGNSAELCSTDPITLDTDWSNCDFVIDPENLIAGDILDIEVTVSLDDTGGSANESAYIAAAQLITVTRN